MIVTGENAKDCRVVRLDSFADVVPAKGELISADDQTGEVVFKDATGEEKRLTLGLHAIRILTR